MRTFAVTFTQNTGLYQNPSASSISATGSVVQLGPWSRDAEKELTRVNASDQALTLTDPDGSIWAWIRDQLPAVDGGAPSLYPPWITVDIDGQREFTGLAPARSISRDVKTGKIWLTAQDWSSGLASKYLGAERAEDDDNHDLNPWLRPYPVGTTARAGVEVHEGLAPWATAYISSCNTGRDQICFPEPCNWIAVGDLLSAVTPRGNFTDLKVLTVERNADGGSSWPFQNGTCRVTLGRQIWPLSTPTTLLSDYVGTFTRGSSAASPQHYFKVLTQVGSNADAPCHVLDLDTVDGIVPGDQLELIHTANSQSWTALQVDAGTRQVVTREEVRDLAVGDQVFFTKESLADLVLVDARLLLARAAAPYAVDLTRYVPPRLPVPVLAWLPLRPLVGADLTSVRDLDAGLASLRVYGAQASAWDGTPEAGWGTASNAVSRAVWSEQVLAAPASLMPNETATLVPDAPARGRVVDNKIRRLTTDQSEEWDPVTAETPTGVLVYDYLLMRKILITRTEIQTSPWNGSAWGGMTTLPLAGGSVFEACVFPGHPGNLLTVNSQGLRCLTLPAGTSSNVVPVHAGHLRTTPWGAYLVGTTGYGRIMLAAGVLSIQWLEVTASGNSLYPATFQGLSETEIVVMARFEGIPATDDKPVTETHLLRLSATPGTDTASAVLASEKVLDGAPRTLGALRDPSMPERVVGHCGGRLFSISRTLPVAYAIERFTPSGLKAQELIEHICQILNAVAVPDPLGTLHIISRGVVEDPIQLTVDTVEIQETRAWEHFYSLVRVSSAKDDTVLSDVAGAQKGGEVLEYSAHPLLWTQSGCDALAHSLASFFGVFRRAQTVRWFWTDASSASPWERLPPVATVQVNGDPTKWLVLGIEDDRVHGRANATLVEVF